MEYNKLIAVTGLPGLYELLSSKSDGAIVRSLDDKATRFVSSRIHNFSHLESIEVYTVRENVNLVDVLKAMESGSENLPDEKDNAALKSYFTKVYPDMDFDRVYVSDLKKMVKWFSILKSNNIEIKLSEVPADEAEVAEVEEAPVAEVEKPKASKAKKAAAETGDVEAPAAEKPAKAKKAATAEKQEAAEADAEKPKAKKAAPKKKAEESDEAEKPKKTAAKKKS